MRFVHLCVVVWWKTVLAPGDWVQYVHISQCMQSWACMPVICSAVHFSVGGGLCFVLLVNRGKKHGNGISGIRVESQGIKSH